VCVVGGTLLVRKLAGVFGSDGPGWSHQIERHAALFAAALLFVTVVGAGIDIHISASQLRNLAISGIIGLVLGDTFLFKCYEIIGARLGMLVMSVAPAISALLAYLLLGEVLSAIAVFGMAVTLFGIALVVLERARNRKPLPAASRPGNLLWVPCCGRSGSRARCREDGV